MQLILRHPLAALLAGGLVLRLLLADLAGFPTDVGYFKSWAQIIASIGPEDFYDSGGFHDYAPGYMWVLWLFGDLDEIFQFSAGQWDYLLKLPPILADLASAYLLYQLLAGRTVVRPFGAVAIYLLLPPVLLLGAIWGQVDSFLAFFILLTIYFLDRERPVAAALAYTVGFLVKPQAIAVLPFFVFWIVRDHGPAWGDVREKLRLPLPPRLWLRMIGASLVATFVVVFPFFPSLLVWRPFVDLVHQVREAAGTTKLATFFAYNFWELLGPDVSTHCDVSTCHDPTTGAVTVGPEFLGLTPYVWGLLLFALSAAAVIVLLRRARGLGFLALGTSLSILAFFCFMTRMHERYLFPFFLPFLVACVLLRSRALWAGFVALATVHFLNLYFVYTNAQGTDLHVQWLYDLVRDTDLAGTGLATSRLLAFVVVGTFVALLGVTYRLTRAVPARAAEGA